MEDSSAEEYRRSIKEAEMILDGKTDELTRELEEEMLRASEEMRFELAARYRDRLRAVAGLRNRQRVIGAAIADTDAVGFFRGAKFCFTVLHYLDGELAGKDYELMEEPLEPDAEAISGLVRQYYTIRGAWPSVILLPVEIEDREPLEQLLTQAAGRRVKIETPKREKLKLVGPPC